LVSFSRNGRHVTAATPPRSQTRVGGGSYSVSLATAAASPPPPPLARKHEVGVFFNFFLLQRPPRHRRHPPSLANARWGCFSVSFSCNGCHVTATTPPRSQTRVGGGSWSVFLATAATSRPPLGDNQHHQPLPRPKSEPEGFVYVSTAPRTPSLAPTAREGGYLYLHVHDHPLPRLKHEWRGF
jgi:hypothetical protein